MVAQSSGTTTLPLDIQPSAYRVEGSGPLLVYLAGLDGTGELFFKQTPNLARSFRVVTFRSREDDAFTYRSLADDIAAIIVSLGEERATIVGESFGGTVALSFALRYPSMVRRLVVINSFPRFRGRVRIKLAAWLAANVPFILLWPFRRGASLLGLLVDGVNREDRRRFWKAIRSVNPSAYARRLQLIQGFDVEDQLQTIQSPVLLIAGGRDLLIPSVREAHSMARRMTNASVEVIEKAGHACLLGKHVNIAELLET